MRRRMLFLSRLLLGCWGVIVVAILGLLLSNAPNTPRYTPFESVSITTQGDSIALPNRIFTCTEIGPTFQCQTEIQDRTLELIFEKGSDYIYNLKNCQAQYSGRAIGCQETGGNYAPVWAYSYDITDLALSPQSLQQVRQKYRGANILRRLGEVGLIRLSAVLSFVTGIVGALFTWLNPGGLSKAFASLTAGLGAAFLLGLALGFIPHEVITSYILAETWYWFVPVASLFTGIGVTVTTALVLWRNLSAVARLPLSILASVGVLTLGGLSSGLFVGLGLRAGGDVLSEVVTALLMVVASVLAIAAARWLWVGTQQSIKRFLSFGNYFGATTVTFYGFVFLLLSLGYAD